MGKEPSRDQGTDQDEVARGDRTAELLATLREQLQAEREANRENRRIIAALTQRIPEPAAPPVLPEHSGRGAASRDEDTPITDAPSEVTRDSPAVTAEERLTTPHPSSLSRGEILAALLPRPRQELPNGTRIQAIAYSVALCSIATALVFLRVPGVPETLLMAALNSPLFFGFWFSLRWLGRHRRSYVLNGLLIAFLVGIVYMGVMILTEERWWIYVATFVVSPALMFVAGGLIGDLVKGWAAQRAPAGEYPAAPGEEALTNREKTRDTIVVALITAFSTMMVPILNWLLGAQQ